MHASGAGPRCQASVALNGGFLATRRFEGLTLSQNGGFVGYPPFAGEGRPTSAHSLDSSSTLAPPGELSPGKTVLCLSMLLRHEDQRGKEVEVRELPLEGQNDPKMDF